MLGVKCCDVKRLESYLNLVNLKMELGREGSEETC